MLRPRRAVPLLLVAGLVACGQSSESTDRSGATSPLPATAVAKPTFESIKEARDEYLRLLEPTGRASAASSDLLDDPNAEITTVRASLDEYARATEELAAALTARNWPNEVAGPIAKLSRQLLAQTEPIKAAARGGDIAQIRRLLGEVPPATAAEQVRDAFKRAGA